MKDILNRLVGVRNEVRALKTTSDLGNWDAIPGNSTEYTYYTGVEAGNPSGAKNVKTIAYKTGAETIVTQTFAWDASDDVTSITAS